MRHAYQASKQAILASLAAAAGYVRDDHLDAAVEGLQVTLHLLQGHQRLKQWTQVEEDAEEEEYDDDR